MKKMQLFKIVKPLAVLAFATAGGTSFAGSTWTFGTPATACNAATVGAGTCSPQTGSDSTVQIKASAFATTGAGATFATATITNQGTAGFGVTAALESTDSPDHAMDNSGATELMMFSFGASNLFELDSVKIGWKQTDADISVFRYTGGSSAPTVAGLNIAGLAGAGWTLVGNYGNLAVDSNTPVNAGNSTSSWWLVSAYNSGFGGSGLDNTTDFFKFKSVTGTVTSKVPEPGSLALLGLGLVGLVASRRRKLASV